MIKVKVTPTFYFYALGIGMGYFFATRNISFWSIVGASFLMLLLIDLVYMAMKPATTNTEGN